MLLFTLRGCHRGWWCAQWFDLAFTPEPFLSQPFSFTWAWHWAWLPRGWMRIRCADPDSNPIPSSGMPEMVAVCIQGYHRTTTRSLWDFKQHLFITFWCILLRRTGTILLQLHQFIQWKCALSSLLEIRHNTIFPLPFMRTGWHIRFPDTGKWCLMSVPCRGIWEGCITKGT